MAFIGRGEIDLLQVPCPTAPGNLVISRGFSAIFGACILPAKRCRNSLFCPIFPIGVKKEKRAEKPVNPCVLRVGREGFEPSTS